MKTLKFLWSILDLTIIVLLVAILFASACFTKHDPLIPHYNAHH